jgi:hypothetical protein
MLGNVVAAVVCDPVEYSPLSRLFAFEISLLDECFHPMAGTFGCDVQLVGNFSRNKRGIRREGEDREDIQRLYFWVWATRHMPHIRLVPD